MRLCRNCGTVMLHGIHYESNGNGEFYECPKCHDRFVGRISKTEKDNTKKNKRK